MLSYIIGELAEVLEDTIVIENNGMGYNVKTPSTVISNMPDVGEMVKVYTYLYVREDAINLYGFLTRDDLNIFKMLINVNGIGPKGALAILSTITTDELRFAILSEDVNMIKACPGIGAKTAQRLIIDLKDKLNLKDTFESAAAKNVLSTDNYLSTVNEAIEALVSLGYGNKEAIVAVKKVSDAENKTSDAVLKEALKNLAIM
ncbi:MAG: Holliday junction branch migration protein RuvA [Eubacteriales bacterium]|nr:Holliday junction branch migration protein RuvA [Eubacteriales bacterium]